MPNVTMIRTNGNRSVSGWPAVISFRSETKNSARTVIVKSPRIPKLKTFKVKIASMDRLIATVKPYGIDYKWGLLLPEFLFGRPPKARPKADGIATGKTAHLGRI